MACYQYDDTGCSGGPRPCYASNVKELLNCLL